MSTRVIVSCVLTAVEFYKLWWIILVVEVLGVIYAATVHLLYILL
jgi:hypothetical protein